MGRGTLGASRGIAAATSSGAGANSPVARHMSAGTQKYLQQQMRAVAAEVDDLNPPESGAWVGAGYGGSQARIRSSANGYEVELFSQGSDTPQNGLFDGTAAGLRKAHRAIKNHLGV